MSLLGIGSVIGGVGSLIGGISAASSQKKQLKLQQGIAKRQQGLFDKASPYYQQLLHYYAQNAGLEAPGLQQLPGTTGQPQANTNQPFGFINQPSQQPSNPNAAALQQSVSNQALGIYGQNPADVYRNRQAEEDINGMANRRGRALDYALGQRGVGGGTLAAAHNQNENDALTQYAKFRRDLAINAGQEQERRAGLLTGALNPGLSMGANAAQNFSNAGAQYGQQASANFNNIAKIFENYAYLQGQKKAKKPTLMSGGGFDSSVVG